MKEWSDEALVIQWVHPGATWHNLKSWWYSLPEYERHELLNAWQIEQMRPPRHRRSYAEYRDACDNLTAQAEELGASWAGLIRQAAKEGRTVPITPAKTALAIGAFDCACRLAQVLVIREPGQTTGGNI